MGAPGASVRPWPFGRLLGDPERWGADSGDAGRLARGLPAQRPLEPNREGSAGSGFFLASHRPSARCAPESARALGLGELCRVWCQGELALAYQRRAACKGGRAGGEVGPGHGSAPRVLSGAEGGGGRCHV